MKTSFWAVAIMVLVGFAACTNPKAKMESEIAELEKYFYEEEHIFEASAAEKDNLHDLYSDYAGNYPESERAAGYIYKAAELSRSVGNYGTAISEYEWVCEDYPEHERAPYALFMQGFTYENSMMDLEAAREKYDEFLDTYPEHELAGTVEFSLQNLGRSPDDIINDFKNKLQESADSLIENSL